MSDQVDEVEVVAEMLTMILLRRGFVVRAGMTTSYDNCSGLITSPWIYTQYFF